MCNILFLLNCYLICAKFKIKSLYKNYQSIGPPCNTYAIFMRLTICVSMILQYLSENVTIKITSNRSYLK
jgi:hypothetical protein